MTLLRSLGPVVIWTGGLCVFLVAQDSLPRNQNPQPNPDVRRNGDFPPGGPGGFPFGPPGGPPTPPPTAPPPAEIKPAPIPKKEKYLAIRAGRVHTVSGPVLHDVTIPFSRASIVP